MHHDISGKPFDTIHPTDIRYFEDLADHDYEPFDAISAEERAELAQIGIQKGTAFAPDHRMRSVLDEAAQVASHMAFAIANVPRDDYRRTPDRYWFGNLAGYPASRTSTAIRSSTRWSEWRGGPLAGPSPCTASSPASVPPTPGEYRDANGNWIDAARTYRLHLPGPIPAKDFWSVVVYDLWPRSMPANGQAHPSLSTYSPGVVTNDDGSVDIYIGPNRHPATKPTGSEPSPTPDGSPSSAYTLRSNPGSKAPGNSDDLEPLD